MSLKKATAITLAVFFLLFLLNSLVMAGPIPGGEWEHPWDDNVWAPGTDQGHPWGDNIRAPGPNTREHPDQELRRPNPDDRELEHPWGCMLRPSDVGHPWGDQLPDDGV